MDSDIDSPNDDVFPVENDDVPPRRRTSSILGIQDQYTLSLTQELKDLHMKLELKENERNLLNQVPEKLTDELRELDITLEKETSALIKDANEQREYAEKMLHEAKYKLDVLQAEVKFLKSLVITSTPSKPNRHLHPQLGARVKKLKPRLKFVDTLRRSLSVQSLNRKDSDDSPTSPTPPKTPESPAEIAEDNREIDPASLCEFKSWISSKPSSVDIGHPFLARIIREDVNPCLAFSNQQLANELFYAALDNGISIQPLCTEQEEPVACDLTGTKRGGRYSIKLGEEGPAYTLCQKARNKIAVVCNFFMYVRYVTQNIIQREESTMYWELIELRRQMALAKLDMIT